MRNYGQRSVVENRSKEKEKQVGKMVIWGGFTNTGRMNGIEKQRKEGKIHPINYTE